MRFVTREKINSMKHAILVDMRSPVQYRDDPITGSVNLPLRNLVNHLTLIRDKSKPVILFGSTTSDEDLKMGGTYSENLGFDTYYTDLKQLQESTEDKK